MEAFDLHISTRILYGQSKEKDFYDHILSLGKRVFLVTGKSSARRLGYLDQIKNGLEAWGIKVEVFEGVEENPTSQTINRAASQARNFGAELVLALGGGSVMDASKCIAALLGSDENDIWPFVLTQPRYGELYATLPLAAIPTTAATASEVTHVATVSHVEYKAKLPIRDPILKPSVAWLNPEFTTQLNAEITRNGAADILSHVFENYILGGHSSPLTDRYCEGIIDTVLRTLPRVIDNPGDLSLRGDLLWASNLALNGLHLAGRKQTQFIMHFMEHSISGYKPEVAHGRGLAVLFPAYFRWMFEKERAHDRFNQLSNKIFHLEFSDPSFSGFSFIERFEDWLRANQLYQPLSSVGIYEKDYEEIADNCIRTYGIDGKMDALGPLGKEDIIDIFRATENQQ